MEEFGLWGNGGYRRWCGASSYGTREYYGEKSRMTVLDFFFLFF